MKELSVQQEQIILSFLKSIASNSSLDQQVRLEASKSIELIKDRSVIEEDLIEIICDQRKLLTMDIRLQAVEALKYFYDTKSDLDLITKAFKTTY